MTNGIRIGESVYNKQYGFGRVRQINAGYYPYLVVYDSGLHEIHRRGELEVKPGSTQVVNDTARRYKAKPSPTGRRNQ